MGNEGYKILKLHVFKPSKLDYYVTNLNEVVWVGVTGVWTLMSYDYDSYGGAVSASKSFRNDILNNQCGGSFLCAVTLETVSSTDVTITIEEIDNRLMYLTDDVDDAVSFFIGVANEDTEDFLER